MDTQTNCKAVQNRVRNLRKNFLPLLLAVAGVLAGGSVGKAATAANIDFSTGYTAGNLVGANGWATYGTANTSPIQVSSSGVALASVASAQGAYKQYTPYQFAEAGGRVFIRVDINVSAASATGADFFLVTREIDNSGGSTQGQPVGKSYFRTYIKSSGAGFVLGWNPHTDTATPTPPVFDTAVLNFNQTHTVLIRCDSFTGRSNDKTYLYVNPSYASDPTTLTPLLSRTTWTGNTDEFSYNVSSGNSGTPLTARLGGFLNLVVKQQAGNALTVSKLMVGDGMTDVGYVAPATGAVNYTNTATTGASTWTTSADWVPSVPSSATNSALIFNGNLLSSALVVDNNTAGNFALNSLTFANTGSGTINLTGNPLKFSSMGTTNPTLTFVNNTALIQRVSNALQLDAALKVTQSGGSVSNSIIDGVVSGVAGLTKSGSGYVYLTSGNNSFGGGVTIENGTLVVENIGVAGSNSSLGTNGTLSLGGGSLTGVLRWGSGSVTNEATDKSFALAGSTGGGTIEVRGTNSLLTLNGAIDMGTNAALRTFTLTGEGGATVNGLISGTNSTSLRVNGSKSRTVILANAGNSFDGPVTIDGNIANQSYRVQVASIGNAGLNSPLGKNATINIGSTVSGSYNFLVWSNTVAETTDKTINLAGSTGGHALINNKGPALLKFTTGLTATGAGAKTLYADQDYTNGVTEFAAAIPDSSLGGATAMNKNGAGTLILSAANTFTGGFTLKGGTLELKNAQSLAAGNALTFANNGTGSDRVKVAYAGSGSDLGNLLLQANATIDLGIDTTAQIRFSSATGWTADKILSIANSSGGGRLYILDTNNVALSQIKSLENPTWPASLDANGLLTFTAPAPVNTAPTITSGGAFSVPENSTAVTTVTATDAEGNALTYSISGGSDADKFWIDSGTGILTFVSAPNFESPMDVGADNVYNLTVQVADGVLAATKDIAVTVTNVSDSPADYKADWLAANGLPAGSSWNSDPNNVGYSLATAYAFGLSPSVNSGAPVALASSPAGSVKIVYLQREDISGVTYTVKSGTDLAAGLNGTVTPQVSANQPVPGKTGYTQYEASYSSGVGKGFLKVQADVP
jgi:autotransporter-associated beta strand protein